MKPTAKKSETKIKDLKHKKLGKEKASQVKGGQKKTISNLKYEDR